jgi:hydroxymethylglutaryl-CoA lyase
MNKITIHDVGMRDGLQMEKQVVPFETKIEWISKLAGSGISLIQAGSFVHPGKVPQMADTDKLFKHFNSNGKPAGVRLSGLVLNEKGLERAMNCNVDLICMGVSASETHSMKNTGMSVEEAQSRIIKMAQEAISLGKRVQVSVQSAFGCGFEGKIDESKVLGIANKYIDAGIYNISLADTAGHGNPEQVKRLFAAIHEMSDKIETACHFHNTYGMGMANCYAAYQCGVTLFESAFGGLGGCPFTKLASGNVCTEDLVQMFQRFGICRKINIDSMIEFVKEVSGYFGRELPGYIYKSGKIPD